MTLGCNICGSGSPTPDRLIPPGWTVLEVAPTRFLVACAECSARYQILVVRHLDQGRAEEARRAMDVVLCDSDDNACLIRVRDLWTGCFVHVEC